MRTDLPSLGVGGQQVHHLDASDQNFLLHAHVCEFGGFSVDWCGSKGKGGASLSKNTHFLKQVLRPNSQFGSDGAPLINGLANHIHDPPQGLGTHWDSDGGAGVQDFLPTNQTFGTIHGDGAHRVLTWTQQFQSECEGGDRKGAQKGATATHRDAEPPPGRAWSRGLRPPGRSGWEGAPRRTGRPRRRR